MRRALWGDENSSAGKGELVKAIRRIVWVMFFVVTLFGCNGKKSSAMDKIEMTPHRIGRLTVDLPAEFAPDGEVSAILIPSSGNALMSKLEVHVVSSGTSRQEFDRAVAQRKEDLAKAGTDTENALKESFKTKDGSVMFRILKVADGYIAELDKLVADNYVRISAVSYDGTYQQVEATVDHFASLIVPTNVSKATDFCLGAVAVRGANAEESAEFSYRSKLRLDLKVEVSIDTFQPDASRSLIARMSDGSSLLNIFDVNHRVLRKDELKVAGMRAQEWLGVAELGGKSGTEYKFVLETLRPTPGPLTPAMQVQLLSGQYDRAGAKLQNSLDDATALQLWDPIIKSIRTMASPLGDAR